MWVYIECRWWNEMCMYSRLYWYTLFSKGDRWINRTVEFRVSEGNMPLVVAVGPKPKRQAPDIGLGTLTSRQVHS